MKKLFFITLLFLFGFNSLIAQHQKNHEKFRTHKIAFITQRLDLTPKEAEKFWPVYNSYEKKVYHLKVLKNRDIKNKIKKSGGIEALSEKEVSQYIISFLQNEEEFTLLKKAFYTDLKKVLPSKKILKLYHTENGFNRKILSEFRNHKRRP